MHVLASLDDQALIRGLDESRRREREELPLLLAHLAEVARRGLHIDLGHRTLFDLCIERLRYPEGAAARRVDASRAAARFPALYSLLRDGELSLTAVARLSSHLTPDNFDEAVSRAAGKRQREVEEIIVELAARSAPASPTVVDEPPIDLEPSLFGSTAERPPDPAVGGADLIEPTAGGGEAATVISAPPRSLRRRDVVRLESPGVVRVSFQADTDLRRKLDRAKELLFRRCPGGRLEDVLGRVLDDYLSRRDPFLKRPAVARPGRERENRRIPQWVKDRVWSRDGGRCSFTAADGRRCSARVGLEYDHVRPWARGGASDDPGNVRLLCRAHNLFLARREFGARVPGRAP